MHSRHALIRMLLNIPNNNLTHKYNLVYPDEQLEPKAIRIIENTNNIVI